MSDWPLGVLGNTVFIILFIVIKKAGLNRKRSSTGHVFTGFSFVSNYYKL